MTSVVFLEIPKPWRVWSGFRNNWITDGEVPNRLEFVGSKPTWSLVNPVDEEDYDETSAFPATKPDMDVFCPPLRSRSQRGWYQIKAFPFPRPFFDTYGSSYQPHITLRTGAELPAELLARILEIVVDNRTLKACALVNHYWAKLCQKRLWATTVLHKRDDAVRLLDFLRTEVSHIRHYIYHVDFHSVGLKPAGQPWFHLLSSIYETLGRDPRPVLEMKMEGPINKGSGCLRSIHHGLPPRSPAFLLAHFSTLSVRHHFHKAHRRDASYMGDALLTAAWFA
ncbi:hypothetical protein NM688_g9190 [Phlebia brevispora]|uniref:Uncharacterized protein n=1 Tax=Phlebia brevispora TaxID=194682 RepID=A0ACC1RIH2_9APHY|nr:hypothetical protein NM688_g9190 [Phlebia brevispora]